MSKTVLYMAISSDGFIAGPDDETPWSQEEWEAFTAFAKTCDVLLLGRRTYEIMRKREEFVKGPEYVVVTHEKSLRTGKFKKISIESKTDMPKVGKIGVIGGGELNGSLALLGVIDEIILDIEPTVLGEGTRLFGSYDIPLKLKLLGSQLIGDGTTQRHYQVVR
ncbi:MAG: dihydrofolate reductase family protein [Candidatus Saccharimonadales bacterium]